MKPETKEQGFFQSNEFAYCVVVLVLALLGFIFACFIDGGCGLMVALK